MRATTEAGALEIPSELHHVLGQPRRLVLTPRSDGAIFLSAERLGNRLARAARQVLGRSSQTYLGRLVQTDGPARFETVMSLGQGEYGIANYDTFFSLLPVDGREERESREQVWGAIEDYHEHLDLERQDPAAHRVSQWLASDILLPLGGHSYLEIGCGAGRNLRALADAEPQVRLHGLDINPAALERARRHLPDARLSAGSLYELGELRDDSVDIVYTSGVLMHVPHENVARVIGELHRIASRVVVHLELHGPSHDFDFHRYPRDYGSLYEKLGVFAAHTYEVFPPGDFRSTGTGSFSLALLVARQTG